MAYSEFPLYIAEVDVSQFYGFHFQLPSKDIGRSDILIHVEYESPTKRTVRYHVWGQFKDTYVRAYLCSASVPGSAEEADIVPKIMFDLNSNKGFYDQVYDFIEHYKKLK